MKRIRFMAIALLLGLFVGTLLACGGGGKSTNNGNTTDTTPTDGGTSLTAESLLKDSSWSFDSTGSLTTITWVNKEGITVKSEAIAGEITIIVNPSTMSLDSVKDLISQNKGEIFAQLPAVGLYWVRISPGQEESFISSLRKSVMDIFPNLASTARALTIPTRWSDLESAGIPGLEDLESGNIILEGPGEPECWENCGSGSLDPPVYIMKNPDGTLVVDANGSFRETSSPNEGASHPEMVNYYAGGSNIVEIPVGSFAITSEAIDIVSLAAVIQRADEIGERPIINLSWGNEEYKPSEPPSWEGYNQSNTAVYLEAIDSMLQSSVSGTKDAVIIHASGNASTDLTSVLVNGLSLYPTAAGQIIEVGALDADGNIAPYSNYSTSTGTMIYVPVTDTTVSGTPIEGTSFAAPQIEYLVNQILDNRPDLTPSQLREILFDPSVAPPQRVQLPNHALGETAEVPVIEDPHDSAVLQTALNVANSRFPGSTFFLSISVTPTGGGTVSANPPCCTYNPGTVVTLTANPATGYTFSGWSGACSGTGSCVVTMDAHKTVTATFTLNNGGPQARVTISEAYCNYDIGLNGIIQGEILGIKGEVEGPVGTVLQASPNTAMPVLKEVSCDGWPKWTGKDFGLCWREKEETLNKTQFSAQWTQDGYYGPDRLLTLSAVVLESDGVRTNGTLDSTSVKVTCK